MAVKIDQDDCISCGICTGACPENALKIGTVSIEVDEAKCIECAVCVDECPMGALTVQ